ncbi:MAG: hypothetical protein K2Q03_01535 [Sphingobacteriaceae bacterium]|nr:hypothetical protein [Sphingobacteriaceae bacterium]
MVYIMIRINQYPQLRLVAWNRHNELIDEAEALELYEKNWRFIDEPSLSTEEQNLINQLVKTYGNGVLHV